MVLQNEICHIEISIDETYTVGSADNRHYEVTLNPGHYRHDDFSKTLSNHIELYSRDFQVAQIRSYHSPTMLQDNMITQIKITDASIFRNVVFDCFGCNFASYKVKKGYKL